ncbi:MAG TPA: ABC-2 family transporter protein [Bacilli bacterium]|nr:ABC-2 family transporter protein [Bacilli bacterium]
MTRLARIYARMMKVHWVILLEYRGDTFFYMFGSFLYPLVTLAVWLAIAADNPVGDYGQQEFILYYLMVLFVSRLTATWDPWEIEVLIREGTLSPHLLRPASFFHWRFSESLVYKLFYGAVMLVVWVIAWPLTDAVHISLEPLLLMQAVVAIVFAVMIRYLLFFCLSLLGFWTTRMLSIVNLVEALGLFLSGRIAPFSLLPDWVQASQNYTPFYWLLGFPVDLLTGKVSETAVWSGLGVQAIWLALFVGLYFLMWNRGLRKFSAVGG